MSIPADDAAAGETDTVERFAADLRDLRFSAGDPTLAALSDRTGVSKSVISDALAGRRLPTERTVSKLVEAFGGDRAAWIARRGALAPRANPARAEARVEIERARRDTRFSVLQTALIAAVAAMLAVVGTSLFWNSRFEAAEASAPENAEGPYLDAANGVDPMRTACKEDAIIAASEARHDNQVHVQLMYSNDCMAVWGRVTRYDGKSAGNSLTMRIYPKDNPDSGRSQERTSDDLQSMYTTMIVEPDVEARICGVAEMTLGGETIDLGPQICA